MSQRIVHCLMLLAFSRRGMALTLMKIHCRFLKPALVKSWRFPFIPLSDKLPPQGFIGCIATPWSNNPDNILTGRTNMRYLLAIAVLTAGLVGNVWASEKEKALDATISMEQAVRTATATQAGSKAYAVEMETEKGRVVYRVEIVAPDKTTQKVYVDAMNGNIVQKK